MSKFIVIQTLDGELSAIPADAILSITLDEEGDTYIRHRNGFDGAGHIYTSEAVELVAMRLNRIAAGDVDATTPDCETD